MKQEATSQLHKKRAQHDAKKREQSLPIDLTATIISKKTRFSITEAYKSTRTNLMFSMSEDTGCKSVLFTSSVPNEGKSTTCINMALTFAQTGAKVLLLDADLRKARTHRYLNLENNSGLADVLGGFSQIDDVINHVESQGIDYVPSGHCPPNPAELLSSNKMKNLMKEMEQRYDYIFIDSPPVTVVTEANVLAPLVTGVVLIVRQNFTMHDLLQEAIDALKFANARILGIIENDCETPRTSYRGRYYYYGKSGRYGRAPYYNEYRMNYSDRRQESGAGNSQGR